MRPELDQPFCGRCGNPCRGFREYVAGMDPPLRCSECAIEVRLIPSLVAYAVGFCAFVSATSILLLAPNAWRTDRGLVSGEVLHAGFLGWGAIVALAAARLCPFGPRRPRPPVKWIEVGGYVVIAAAVDLTLAAHLFDVHIKTIREPGGEHVWGWILWGGTAWTLLAGAAVAWMTMKAGRSRAVLCEAAFFIWNAGVPLVLLGAGAGDLLLRGGLDWRGKIASHAVLLAAASFVGGLQLGSVVSAHSGFFRLFRDIRARDAKPLGDAEVHVGSGVVCGLCDRDYAPLSDPSRTPGTPLCVACRSCLRRVESVVPHLTLCALGVLLAGGLGLLAADCIRRW
ncbi:MAG: hypothetical protein HYY93_13990 [Planctomycetes bacterium]|nr:hypothetical protein [Planctomycetota bacterium]